MASEVTVRVKDDFFAQLEWWKNVPFLYDRFVCTPLPEKSSICLILPSPPYAVCNFRRTNFYFLRDFYNRPLIQRIRRLLAGQTIIHTSPPVDVLLSNSRELFLARIEIPHEGRKKKNDLDEDEDDAEKANPMPSALGGASFKELPRCEDGEIVRRTHGIPIANVESADVWETPLTHGPYQLDYWKSGENSTLTSAVCDCPSCSQWCCLVAVKTSTGAVWVFNPQGVFVDPFVAQAEAAALARKNKRSTASPSNGEENGAEEDDAEDEEFSEGEDAIPRRRECGLTDLQLSEAAQSGVPLEFPLEGAAPTVSMQRLKAHPHTVKLGGLRGRGGNIAFARNGGSDNCFATFVLGCSEDGQVVIWFLSCLFLCRGKRTANLPGVLPPLYQVHCGAVPVNSIAWAGNLLRAPSDVEDEEEDEDYGDASLQHCKGETKSEDEKERSKAKVNDDAGRPRIAFVTTSHNGILRTWREEEVGKIIKTRDAHITEFHPFRPLLGVTGRGGCCRSGCRFAPSSNNNSEVDVKLICIARQIITEPLTGAVVRSPTTVLTADWTGALALYQIRSPGPAKLLKRYRQFHSGPILRLLGHPRLSHIFLTVGADATILFWDLSRTDSSELAAVHAAHKLIQVNHNFPLHFATDLNGALVLDARWMAVPLPDPFASGPMRDTSRSHTTGLVPGGAVFSTAVLQGVSLDDNNLLQLWAISDDVLVDVSDANHGRHHRAA